MQGFPWQSSGLDLCTPNERGVDSIPGWGTKILHAIQWGLEKKRTQVKVRYGHLELGRGSKEEALRGREEMSENSRQISPNCIPQCLYKFLGG